jgi:hypothetical protein
MNKLFKTKNFLIIEGVLLSLFIPFIVSADGMDGKGTKLSGIDLSKSFLFAIGITVIFILLSFQIFRILFF